MEAKLALPMKGRRSPITVGYDSRIVLVSGGNTVSLEGRFFRAGEKPIEVSRRPYPPTGERTLVIDRVGGKVSVSVDGQVVYSGACDTGLLPLLGVDPGDGTVQLIAMSAQGHLPEAGGEGIWQRLWPADALGTEDRAGSFAPVIVHEGPDERMLPHRLDATGPLELYPRHQASQWTRISVMRSKDEGLTSGPSETAFSLPGKIYYAVMAGGGAGMAPFSIVFPCCCRGPGGHRGRLHTKCTTRGPCREAKAGRSRSWSIPGYVGSIWSLIELALRRLSSFRRLANPDGRGSSEVGRGFWVERHRDLYTRMTREAGAGRALQTS